MSIKSNEFSDEFCEIAVIRGKPKESRGIIESSFFSKLSSSSAGTISISTSY